MLLNMGNNREKYMKKNRLTPNKRYLCKKRLGPNEKIHTSTKNFGKESQKKHSFFLSIPKISPPPLLAIWANFSHLKRCQSQKVSNSILGVFTFEKFLKKKVKINPSPIWAMPKERFFFLESFP